MRRRAFLKLAAAGTLGWRGTAWAWAARATAPGPRLAVVFLRGAADGLNVVVPYAEDEYYEYRPTLALAHPGGRDGVLDLDGRFGLHPALSPLLDLWRRRELAFVHACGSPDPDRSHFEAQAYMETATPGVRTTRSGWLNRLAAALDLHHAAQTVAFGANEPLIVRGPAPTTTFPAGRGALRPQPLDRDPVRRAFDPLYHGDPRLGAVYAEALHTRAALLAAARREGADAANGAGGPAGFPGDAERAGRIMAGDPHLRLVFFSLGGWDTHVNEGAAQGTLAARLAPLGRGLMALRAALGRSWHETVVLVVSEFGRTAHENGNRGTDHGHGNVHWVLGGAVRGGRVYGTWPGLAESALYQGRDLAVTTDFRSVIDVLLANHLGLTRNARERVLPGFGRGHKGLDGLVA